MLGPEGCSEVAKHPGFKDTSRPYKEFRGKTHAAAYPLILMVPDGGLLLRHSFLETVVREHSYPRGQMGCNPAESISAAGTVSESIAEECILLYPIATEYLSQIKWFSGG